MHIAELEILSADLEKTEKFYGGLLGLKVLQKSNQGISFIAGSTVLHFKLSNRQPVYHFAFNVPCNQLHEALQWTQQKTEILEISKGHIIADFTNWNARSFYFYDFNGNILECIARLDLLNQSSKAFGISSILCISEIGVATDDVTTESNKLLQTQPLSLFSKQPALNNFAALGDDNGLLILSSANRHWYPTEKTAGQYYPRVLLKCNSDTVHLTFHPDYS